MKSRNSPKALTKGSYMRAQFGQVLCGCFNGRQLQPCVGKNLSHDLATLRRQAIQFGRQRRGLEHQGQIHRACRAIAKVNWA